MDYVDIEYALTEPYLPQPQTAPKSLGPQGEGSAQKDRPQMSRPSGSSGSGEHHPPPPPSTERPPATSAPAPRPVKGKPARAQRRQRQREEPAAEDQPAASTHREAREPRASDQRRLIETVLRIETDIRELHSWSMRSVRFSEGSDAAIALRTAMDAWLSESTTGKAHPRGPPRRAAGLAVIGFVAQHSLNDVRLTPWRAFHEGLTRPADVEERSLQFCQASRAHNGDTILRLRPWMSTANLWAPAWHLLVEHANATGGAELRTAAPPGPLPRALREQLRARTD